MDARAELLDGLVLGVRPGTIRQQHDRERAVRVYPKRCAGVSEVTVGLGREVLSGAGGRSGTIPAEGAARSGLLARKFGDCLGLEDGISAVQPVLCEFRDFRRGGEDPGVSSNAA